MGKLEYYYIHKLMDLVLIHDIFVQRESFVGKITGSVPIPLSSIVYLNSKLKKVSLYSKIKVKLLELWEI